MHTELPKSKECSYQEPASDETSPEKLADNNGDCLDD